MYYKGKWCTTGGKDPLFGHVDGFQIDPKIFKKDFNQEIVSDRQVLNPLTLFQHDRTNDALDEVGSLTDSVQRQNGQVRKPAQAEGQRHAEHPHEAAVKQEGYEGLSAGTEGEIGGVEIGAEGHHHGGDPDQLRRQMPHGVGGVVDAGERLGNRRHQAAEHDARRNGHGDELPVGVPHILLRVPRAQHLPHDNANGIAHGKIDDAPQIEQGAANVHGRHHVQPAGGVALAQDGHAAGPEEFVDQQGHTLDGDGSQ